MAIEPKRLAGLTNGKAVGIKSTNQPIDKLIYRIRQFKIIWIVQYFTSGKYGKLFTVSYQALYQTICHCFSKYRTE